MALDIRVLLAVEFPWARIPVRTAISAMEPSFLDFHWAPCVREAMRGFWVIALVLTVTDSVAASLRSRIIHFLEITETATSRTVTI